MLVWKSLYDAQLPNAKTTLYTCPAGKTCSFKVSYVNVDASARTVNLYIKRSGSSSRRVIPKDLTMSAGDAMHYGDDDDPHELSAGDIIEGDASAAATVDALITGAER